MNQACWAAPAPGGSRLSCDPVGCRKAAERMSHVRNSWLMLLPLVLVLGIHGSAQTHQFLPEIDVCYKLNPDLRIWFQAEQTREAGDPTSAEIGPSLDFYLKSWLKLKDVTAFDLARRQGRSYSPLVIAIFLTLTRRPKTASSRL